MDAQPASRADAFADAAAPHDPASSGALTLVVGDREGAEDLAQDAYPRAYHAWDRFNGRDVRAWLHTIGLRLAFNERDRRRRFLGLFGRRSTQELHAARDRASLPSCTRGYQQDDAVTRGFLAVVHAPDGYIEQRTERRRPLIPRGTHARHV